MSTSTTDILRSLKPGASHIFENYSRPAQVSSYMARVRGELGYKFSARSTNEGVLVMRLPSAKAAPDAHVCGHPNAQCDTACAERPDEYADITDLF